MDFVVQGNYADSKPLYERALVIREKRLGSAHPDVAILLNSMAASLGGQVIPSFMILYRYVS